MRMAVRPSSFFILSFAVMLSYAVAFEVVVPSPAAAQTASDVTLRDELIAQQEALLNVYRCRFRIDTDAVTGGCRRRKPIKPAAQPEPFTRDATQQDIEVRDELIAQQEALLNVYRCRFRIDTDAVTGGCPANVLPALTETVRISVLASRPSGRCAELLPVGVYEWEICAWRGYRNDDYNPSLSELEAQDLINLIWAELDIPGKHRQPPTNHLDPSDTHCSTPAGEPTSCYEVGRHHIRRIEADVQTLLHETAHALAANAPLSQACWNIYDDGEHTICSHHDLFRCAADYLYQEYAGLPPSGVCGTTHLSQRPSQWKMDGGWRIWNVSSRGEPYTNLDADEHSRPPPYQDSRAYLGVQCSNGKVDVYLGITEGNVAGQPNIQGRIPVAYMFLTPDELQADDLPDDLNERAIHSRWGQSPERTSAFMPNGDKEDFINDLVRLEGWGLLVTVWGSAGDVLGNFVFTNRDAERQIRPVTEQCGWVWGQSGVMGNESTWRTWHSDTYGAYAQTQVDWQIRPSPHEGAKAWLTVQCDEGDLEVYVLVESGFLAGQTRYNGRIPVAHVVLTGDEHRDEQRRDQVIDSRGVRAFWSESIRNRGAFMPEYLREDFINGLVAPDDRYAYIWVEGEDGNQFGFFVFRSVNARPHIAPVTEGCGWTWG